jgi:LPXTG-motif cell wall-anchored protein
VTVVDGATNVVTTTISVGSGSQSVAVNPGTNRVYVANRGDNTVSVIDGASDSVISTVPVGGAPSGIDVNTTTGMVFVPNAGSGNVSVIDGSTNTVTNTIASSPATAGVAVDSNANMAYVANYSGGDVTGFSGATMASVLSVPVGSGPAGVAANPNTHKIYVVNNGDNTVSVFAGLEPPSAPQRVTATLQSETSVVVSWSRPAEDGGSPITGYAVTLQPGGAHCTSTARLHCTFTNLPRGTQFTVIVTASNLCGDSPGSAPVLVSTPSEPPAPDSGGLPATGSSILLLGAVGAGSLFAGAVLLGGLRRRRESEEGSA